MPERKKNKLAWSTACPLFKLSGEGVYLPHSIFLLITSKHYKQPTYTFSHKIETNLHLHGTIEFDYSQELDVILLRAGNYF